MHNFTIITTALAAGAWLITAIAANDGLVWLAGIAIWMLSATVVIQCLQIKRLEASHA